MPVKHIRNKHLRRKRKGAADKRRRVKVQKKRVVALGLPAEKAEKLNQKEIRTLLRNPKKTAARLAKKSA
ncbi:MAG: hypothetical protein H3C50_08370 [Kiritimatiellae bacterium]|nr:hypothetical protein [Kiritimatiellia bacterium]MCO5067654.1 hypothetical protein [Kiritimatiellia bacterium]